MLNTTLNLNSPLDEWKQFLTPTILLQLVTNYSTSLLLSDFLKIDTLEFARNSGIPELDRELSLTQELFHAKLSINSSKPNQNIRKIPFLKQPISNWFEFLSERTRTKLDYHYPSSLSVQEFLCIDQEAYTLNPGVGITAFASLKTDQKTILNLMADQKVAPKMPPEPIRWQRGPFPLSLRPYAELSLFEIKSLLPNNLYNKLVRSGIENLIGIWNIREFQFQKQKGVGKKVSDQLNAFRNHLQHNEAQMEGQLEKLASRIKGSMINKFPILNKEIFKSTRPKT